MRQERSSNGRLSEPCFPGLTCFHGALLAFACAAARHICLSTRHWERRTGTSKIEITDGICNQQGGLPWAVVKSIFDSLKQGGTCDEPDFCRHFSSSVAKDVMTGNCVDAGEPPVSNGSRFPMPENCSLRTVLNAFTRNPRSHANETVEGPVGEQAAQKDHGFGTEADGIARFWTAGAECLADRIRDQIRR